MSASTKVLSGVLSEREYNGYDDSDFYATVWDGEVVREVMVGTTRGVMEPVILVPATPEERALADVYLRVRKALVAFDLLQSKPYVGSVVKVVSGRKIPIGTVGRVFWAGMKSFDKYGRWPALRLGVEMPDGSRSFTAASNVVVTDWDEAAERKALSQAGGRFI
jgi:hypothetical protein